MEVLEYGNPKQDKIILIHGFESPYQIWDDYVEYYKKDYCVIVPILTGHNVNENTDFESFEKCVKELEDYYISKYGKQVFAVYGMSMGGVFASILWQNENIKIDKLIMESSPLLGFENFMIKILTKQYLTITHKAQARDKKTVRGAVNSMVTEDKLDILKDADYIFREEIAKNGLDKSINQYFAVLTDLRSVGVMGDERTYENPVALRAVTSSDAMTADWAHLPYDFLAKVSNDIINKVKGVNRVCYDISSKPPSTIEWE